MVAVILAAGSVLASSCSAEEPSGRASGGDRTSSSPSAQATTTSGPSRGKGFVVAAVGDIASPSENGRQVATARAVDDIDPDLVLGLGDFQYQRGNLRALNNSYDRSWGRFISRTYPINGTSHDLYGTGGYVDYWNGGSAGGHGTTPIRQEQQWSYSFDIGDWHFIALNTSCWQRDDCDPDRWTQWLRDDLGRSHARCTIAYMHEPYWTSPTDEHDRDTSTRPWIDLLFEHGVDVLLQAHNHNYERFAPQTPGDERDDDAGVQAFVVGTGGIGLYEFKGTAANSEARQDESYGVLRLDLSPTSYRWRFVVSDGKEFSDEGERPCH
ncbi:3',5'-cyclic AMP phosphodiesterase CpdA [Kribbella orskensis]|uniref:3',5'-cyclic AMP phosphodiesterase CpdA n=2 Tax=Kribbellaceae TaxID=2726069 RepID=A0ABY2BI28_9ACTN|nr:3',5'-cyclic AMP phosphodiesterase CpdA [Kribbella sp. VKM Ac-2500]TCO18847.1 3',5'-cyclic AMP phosphodiesterase CpdA [Kribbella orskensis]